MTTTYTGVNGGSFFNTVTGPAAGEYVTAASVGLVAQSAANEIKYLYDVKENIAKDAPQRPADPTPLVALTVDVANGDTVYLPFFTGVGTPSCTLANPSKNGLTITLLMPKAHLGLEVALFCNIKRADASTIAALSTATITNGYGGITDAYSAGWLECRSEGGVWRGRKWGGPVTPGASW